MSAMNEYSGWLWCAETGRRLSRVMVRALLASQAERRMLELAVQFWGGAVADYEVRELREICNPVMGEAVAS